MTACNGHLDLWKSALDPLSAPNFHRSGQQLYEHEQPATPRHADTAKYALELLCVNLRLSILVPSAREVVSTGTLKASEIPRPKVFLYSRLLALGHGIADLGNAQSFCRIRAQDIEHTDFGNEELEWMTVLSVKSHLFGKKMRGQDTTTLTRIERGDLPWLEGMPIFELKIISLINLRYSWLTRLEEDSFR